MTSTTIHEEIKQILSLYINCNTEEQENAEDINECTTKILSVLEFELEKQELSIICFILEKLNRKITFYEKEKKDPKVTINDNAWDCLDSKIKVLQEIKRELQKK